MGRHFTFLFLLLSAVANAQTLSLDLGGESGSLSGRIVQLLMLTTVMSIAPSLLIMVTSFTRIAIVLSFLRSALGLQQSPPNSVIMSLALFISAFIMAPTFETAYDTGLKPLIQEEIDEMEAFSRISKPFHHFMVINTGERDLKLFMDLTKTPVPNDRAEIPLKVVVPAFMISELNKAFQIGFFLFLPFLIIDMLIASILMSMGMMMVPPVMIALPFKLIFFVLMDGWNVLTFSLIESFKQ